MNKYSPKAILEKSPNTIVIAIFAVSQWAFALLDLDASRMEQSLGSVALLAVLNLFVAQPNTTTNAMVDSQVAQAQAETTANITAYLAQADPPVEPEVIAGVEDAVEIPEDPGGH